MSNPSSANQLPKGDTQRPWSGLLACYACPGNLEYEGILYTGNSPSQPPPSIAPAPIFYPPSTSQVTATSSSQPTPSVTPAPTLHQPSTSQAAGASSSQTNPVPARTRIILHVNYEPKVSAVPASQLCPLCQTSFGAGTHLKHLATHIPAGSNFCPFCSQYFSGTALEHLTVHSEDRPFACKFNGCGHAYKRKALLNNHVRKEHGKNKKSKAVGDEVEEEAAVAHGGSGDDDEDEDEDEEGGMGYFSTAKGGYVRGGGHMLGGHGARLVGL